ncbi:MAG TPA: NAD kinase [Candidatus Agrococcus pullicola]|uniref:NAD kinase n=1 Tax=Candidatus Agrococcus pullicola TaxID=2838429 RepID=A0A9D2C9K5_9MICO|nr:NAD kinase [Candidatus Agrococcus pullicola]
MSRSEDASRAFLIAFHSGRDASVATAATIVKRLAETEITPVVLDVDRPALLAHSPELHVIQAYDGGDVDLIITLGGDGTILRASELQRETRAPLLGINMGHVGFLAEAEVAELERVVERAVAGDYTVEERLVLDVSVEIGGEERFRTWAVNEAAIEKVDSGRMVEVVLAIDARPISSFGADAVIMATPTGSTAYSFSAGGPIVWPEADVMLMVPLGAHALFTRALVAGPDSRMTVKIAERSVDGATLWCDSRRSYDLPQGASVHATRHAQPLRLARLSQAPFADRLVAKFHLPVEGWRGGS